tara:strand:- start:1327 stop:1641 length:315 start_codon:yes stop_codon:yes gene_type:complete
MRTLIFYEGIVEPPTESLAIRGLCLYANFFQKKRQILLETEKNNTDLYYKWVKHNGLWDFIEDIVHPEHDIYGLRIATVKVKPPSIKVDRISWDNLNDLLYRIK